MVKKCQTGPLMRSYCKNKSGLLFFWDMMYMTAKWFMVHHVVNIQKYKKFSILYFCNGQRPRIILVAGWRCVCVCVCVCGFGNCLCLC